MYNRSIKMWDEPHAPEDIERALQSGKLNKGKFLTLAHNHSYFLQMKTIYNLHPESILEIGPGDKFVGNYFSCLGILYETVDIIAASNPTYLSSLEDLKATEVKLRYDVVCSFQMLEHSPYENFITNLEKMTYLSKKYVFISLPYSCYGLNISFILSLGQNKLIKKKLSFFLPTKKRNRRYREEFVKEFPWAVHYWEIGRRGYNLKKIMADIRSVGLRIIDCFHSDNPFHYFILLKK